MTSKENKKLKQLYIEMTSICLLGGILMAIIAVLIYLYKNL